MWKREGLKDACEDFGQVAAYNGGHPEGDHHLYTVDEEHVLEKGLPERIREGFVRCQEPNIPHRFRHPAVRIPKNGTYWPGRTQTAGCQTPRR